MKDYIEEFYNDGLGYIFIQIPKKFINKHIKNKKIANIIMLLIKILYTICAILLMVYIIYKKWPF